MVLASDAALRVHTCLYAALFAAVRAMQKKSRQGRAPARSLQVSAKVTM
jgi:hypothetical protein